MNLINEKITHTIFGEGEIVDQVESILTIKFKEDTKEFVYPDVFAKFITVNDPKKAKTLEKILAKKAEEQEKIDKEREEQREERALEQERNERIKNHQIHESSQAVFWLDEEEQETIFTDWQAFTGKVQSGVNKDQPNKAVRLSPNSAGLLTVRAEDQPETERRIIGLYMVPETFFGNQNDDGMVPAHEDFRIELTDEESEKMLFWDYYINKNYPHRTTWNSGKYRYYDNVWTAQILKNIIAIKTDEEEIAKVKTFLEYFCRVNALDIENIPEPAGALKQ